MTCLAILPTSDMSHAWKMAGPLRMWSLPMRHCLWDFPQRFTLNMPWSLYRWIPLTIYATELEWANSTVVFFGLTYGRRGIQSFMTAITSYLGSLYGNGYFFWIFDRIPPALVFCLVFFWWVLLTVFTVIFSFIGWALVNVFFWRGGVCVCDSGPNSNICTAIHDIRSFLSISECHFVRCFCGRSCLLSWVRPSWKWELAQMGRVRY